jgi:hypothetical protein
MGRGGQVLSDCFLPTLPHSHPLKHWPFRKVEPGARGILESGQADGWGAWRKRRVCGTVPSPGAAASSLGIFHPGSRGPARSEPRFVSSSAPGTFRRKLPMPRPRPPLPQPRPSPSPRRTPVSEAIAALSSPGCLGRTQKPGNQERPLCARKATPRSHI